MTERKIPHRNATGDQQKHNLNWFIKTYLNKSTMETTYAASEKGI